MKLESYITMMDAFLKRRLAMTMNHGVQRTLGPMERRKEYRNLCYNFEYEWGTNIPHCAKKGVCDEDCEYMRNFKE